MYPPELVKPMIEELTSVGFEELKTAAAVKQAIEQEGCSHSTEAAIVVVSILKQAFIAVTTSTAGRNDSAERLATAIAQQVNTIFAHSAQCFLSTTRANSRSLCQVTHIEVGTDRHTEQE